MKKHRITSLLFIALICATALSAKTPRDEILADKNLSAANYRAYPAPQLTTDPEPPAGYAPYYINAYARHGSRFLIGEGEYDRAVAPLAKADSAGVLTAKGKEVLARLKKVREMSRGRLGELTDVGRAQHRGIAGRMYERFPSVFPDSAEIEARSTDVPRCMMSMMAECLELQSRNPSLHITHDASKADMSKMNNWQLSSATEKKYADAIHAVCDTYKRRIDGNRMLGTLISDKDWIKTNLPDTHEVTWDIFYAGSNMQSHSDTTLCIMDIFTPEECYELWKINNTEWYCRAGNSPITEGKMPFVQRELYQDFLAAGDRAAASGENGALLRFGHESVVIPTAVFFDLDGAGYSSTDFEKIHENWAAYRIFPMACNIQFVYYKADNGGDVLVRVLLNEKDAKLPIEYAVAPYYRWQDVSRYYHNKLDTFLASEKE